MSNIRGFEGNVRCYYCHRCNIIAIIPISVDDFTCPACNDGFIEECANAEIPNNITITRLTDPFIALRHYLRTARSTREISPSGLEHLIRRLVDHNPRREGTPAAATAAESLPEITADEELLNSNLDLCAICTDDFQLGLKLKKMPCNHVFHSECRCHNSCPLCRHELPAARNRAEAGRSGNSAPSATIPENSNNQNGNTFRI